MKVVVCGHSDFVISFSSMQQSFKKYNIELKNLSLPATNSSFYIFLSLLKENYNELKESDLVIILFNTSDDSYISNKERVVQEIYFTFNQLSLLQNKVLVLLKHNLNQRFNFFVERIYRKLCVDFGFSLIDFNENNHLRTDILKLTYDNTHYFNFVLGQLAEKIAINFHNFPLPKKNINNKINFKICFASEMINSQNCELIKFKCHLFDELKIYKITKENFLRFPEEYENYYIIDVISNNQNAVLMSSLCFKTEKTIKTTLLRPGLACKGLNEPIKITNKLKVLYDYLDERINEDKWYPYDMVKSDKKLGYCGVIAFLLIDNNEISIDIEEYENQTILIPREYNFNHLAPPVELYKEVINEYCSKMDPRKLAPLQNQIKENDNIISTLNQEKTMLQNELNSFSIKKQNLEIKNLEQDLKNKELQSCVLKKELGNKFVKNININYINKNSAKSRIQNHLSYKLGQALITNSKSILGYIRMPFVLSYIKDKHKFEQKAYEEKIKENPNLALPPLEAYPDYKEALKEKECFTYKLGEAFIKASKNWYGGGYIKFMLKDVPRLKREFGKR